VGTKFLLEALKRRDHLENVDDSKISMKRRCTRTYFSYMIALDCIALETRSVFAW
jgi:hypothetical protein